MSADNYHRITEGYDGHWWVSHGFASNDKEDETLIGIASSLEEATRMAQANGDTEYGITVDFLNRQWSDA